MPRPNPQQPLLAPPGYSGPLDCLVCGGGNRETSDRCRSCAAPLELARQAATAKRAPHLVAVLGAASAGKTSYLGMAMDMLTRRVGGLRAEPKGALSIALQERATTALASGVFPEKTGAAAEQWDWTACRVECRRRRRSVDLVFADPSGDAWEEQANSPSASPALGGLLERSAAAIVLIDAQQLRAGDHTGEFALLKLLTQLPQRTPKRWPLALVLTKADGCSIGDSGAEAFAASHAEALLTACRTRRPDTRVFAAQVAGGAATRRISGSRGAVPLRTEPRGVVEPIGWLLERLP
ncbi:MAG: hypothetical protein AAGJ46_21690 [Planctomycetota bacterium]